MDDFIKKHLSDILNAIEEIDDFYDGKKKLYKDFENNLLLRRGVERNIEIIGEAINRILKVNSDIQITNARKIVDTRNWVSHSYDAVSNDILWSIVVNHLPKLKEEVRKLLYGQF